MKKKVFFFGDVVLIDENETVVITNDIRPELIDLEARYYLTVSITTKDVDFYWDIPVTKGPISGSHDELFCRVHGREYPEQVRTEVSRFLLKQFEKGSIEEEPLLRQVIDSLYQHDVM